MFIERRVFSHMTMQEILRKIIPEAGTEHLLATYINWAGTGFICALIAGAIDHYSEVPYAAYYTGAVNEAIGFRFWVLLSVVGLLLLCASLPLVYVSHRFNRASAFADRLRRAIYMFFLVGFDEGGLMIGILLANLVYASDKAALLASKSFLFSGVNLFSIVLLIVLNSGLWLIGESVYNPGSKNYSGIVRFALDQPLKYLVPGYLLFTALVLTAVLNRQ